MSDRTGEKPRASVMEQSQSLPDRATTLAFLAFVFLGGGASISIRFVYEELDPFWSGAFRFAMAALIFFFLMFIRKVPLPRGRSLVGAILFGALTGGAVLFGYLGLTKTQAGLFQTIAAVVPLLTLLFAVLHRLERLHLQGVIGGILAVAGIAIAVSGSLAGGVSVSIPHILAILASSACFAESSIIIKLFPPSHPYATNAISATMITLILGAGSLLSGETWTIPVQTSTWLALAFIVLGTSVGGFLAYLFVLKNWTATGASYAFVLFPIVTVILASILTDETISLVFLIGAAVVLAGVYVGALMPRRIAVPVPEPAPEPKPTMEDIQERPGLPTCI